MHGWYSIVFLSNCSGKPRGSQSHASYLAVTFGSPNLPAEHHKRKCHHPSWGPRTWCKTVLQRVILRAISLLKWCRLGSYKNTNLFRGASSSNISRHGKTGHKKNASKKRWLRRRGWCKRAGVTDPVGSDGHGIGWKLADQPSRYLPPPEISNRNQEWWFFLRYLLSNMAILGIYPC